MYKGLKPELVGVVESLNPGDEVILSLYWPDSYPEFTKGHGTVEKTTDSYISLRMKWGLEGRLARFVQGRILGIDPAYRDVVKYQYNNILRVETVD